MDLPEGFHREVIEARESISDADYSEIELKKSVAITPLESGGANFKTNVLIKKSSSKLIYKPSIGVAFFCFIFLAVGLGIIFYGLYPLLKNDSETINIEWFLLLFGLIFAGAGGFMFYYFYQPRIFDKQKGLYYRAYSFKLHQSQRKGTDKYIPLKSIIAIQIIGEHVRSDDGSYKSFELNLVLEDSSRKNVVDHGNLKTIISDAQLLSEFLNVPIWHAASNKD